MADFKCHTSASETGPVHCVFHDGRGAIPAWFSPSSTVSAGCAKANPTSILAKLGHLPDLKGGQFHFRGSVKACVSSAALADRGDQARAVLVKAFLDAMGAPGTEGRVLDHSVRKGKTRYSLDSLPDSAVVSGYCIGKD